jgi:4-hydroxy-3-methylbut-2-enyl diphosphate reductase
VVFSAHGVSPEVRAAAAKRRLRVVDATCPLVSKVHAEARRFARSRHTILLVGHAGHEEVAGTAGEAPDDIRLVTDADDARRVTVDDPERVAVLTQTTLAVDEAQATIEVLRERFPALAAPRASDICYATQNRQDAVRALAAECEVVLVIGSANSSNSVRLVEVAERHGAVGHLIDSSADIDPEWLSAAETIGVTAGASAPEALVQEVVEAIGALGTAEVREIHTANETVVFKPAVLT